MPEPSVIAHADWGTDPRKRWLACATLGPDGAYYAAAPEPAGDPGTLLTRLAARAGSGQDLFAGFDFPIGLPGTYAQRAGIRDFLALLPMLGTGEWREFYDVARRADEVSLYRPFYPQACRTRGSARLEALWRGLGLPGPEGLRRRCEAADAGRPAAAPLFWTVGGQQVGKAAILGWRDMLGPALRAGAPPPLLWPFAGALPGLFGRVRPVVAETYPAEFYGHLFAAPGRAWRWGKRVQAARAAHASDLLAAASRFSVVLDEALRAQIEDGFGPRPGGEDPFDAVVGLLGMAGVVRGAIGAAAPQDHDVLKVEGWILGQPASQRTERRPRVETCGC